MATLKLYLLGSPRLTLDEEAITIGRQKALALLFYLAIKGEPQRRDSLAALLWPDLSQQEARRALSRHLFEVKEQLGDGWLTADQQTIALPTTPDLWLDVVQFRAHLAECAERTTPCRDALTAAVALYRDDFLSGFTLPDCPEFDDWQYFQGEALRQQFAAALAQLIELLSEQGEYDAALPHARRWLAVDPLHEPAHRILMQLYAQSGQPAAALRHYQRCVAILADELGAPPSVETTALYDQIRTGQYGQAEMQSHDRTTATDGSVAAKPAPVEKTAQPALQVHVAPPTPPTVRYDWREAPTIEQLYGRATERQQLTNWLVGERCRLISILGIGGLGKTTLAAQVVRDLATGENPPFARILWRSLLNAPPLAELLPDMLHFLALPDSVAIPESLDNRLALLRDFLSRDRSLLVLDNLESLLEAGERGGRFRPGYEEYGQLLHYLGRHEHQSTLLLTSREQPQEIGRLERSTTAVRSLALTGLSLQAGQELLHQQGLQGDPEAAIALIRRYSGHPLALMLVAETIAELYLGDLAAFLAEETLIFDDIRDVLDQHFARLSPLEQEILTWLAIEREPVTAQALAEDLLGPVNRGDFLEALRALQRRMLLQSFPDGVGLQNVVTEYTTNRFVSRLIGELGDNQLACFNRYALIKATTKEYVRESQARLILNPITARLVDRFGRDGLLQKLRGYPNRLRAERLHGYAAGNLLNWLLALAHEVANVDLSGLTIRQAYLRGKILHNLDLRGANFKETLFTDTFDLLRCVAFSPDGSLLAGGTSTGHIRFWRTTDWQLVQSWKVSNDQVVYLAFSLDGQMLVSTDLLVTQLWDCSNPAAMSSPQLLQTFRHECLVILFSPTGRFLVSAGREYLCFWDIASGQLLHSLEAHTQSICSIALSPDGRTLASGSHDCTVRLWNIAAAFSSWEDEMHSTSVSNGHARQTLLGHSGPILAVAFSPDGQLLASASFDNTVRLWHVASGQLSQTLRGHQDAVGALAFSPDGRLLVSGDLDHIIQFWDVATGQTIQTYRGHQGRISWLAFSPDGQILASSSHDQSVRLWAIAAASTVSEAEGLNRRFSRATEAARIHLLQTLQGYRRGIWCLAFSQDRQTLASGRTDGVLQIWDAKKAAAAQPRRTLVAHASWVMSIALSPDGKLLASGDQPGTIHVWDLTQTRETPLHTFKTNQGMVRALCFTHDGKTLISSTSVDRTVWLWDVVSGQRLYAVTSNTYLITSLALSPDNQTLAGGTFQHQLLLWNLTTGRLLHTIEGHSGQIWAVAFSPAPQGRPQTLASSGDDGVIQLWDVTKGDDQPRQSLRGDHGPVRALCFSPDGRLLASGGQDQMIRLWDIGSGQVPCTLVGHTDWVRSLCFSADGETLLSGSDDGAIKVWDVRSGHCLTTRRPDRPYERMKISGVTGLAPAQISALKELGAVDEHT